MSDINVYIGTKSIGKASPGYGEFVGVGVFVESANQNKAPVLFSCLTGVNVPSLAVEAEGLSAFLIGLTFSELKNQNGCSVTVFSKSQEVMQIANAMQIGDISVIEKVLISAGVSKTDLVNVIWLWDDLFETAENKNIKLTWVLLWPERRLKQMDLAQEAAEESALSALIEHKNQARDPNCVH